MAEKKALFGNIVGGFFRHQKLDVGDNAVNPEGDPLLPFNADPEMWEQPLPTSAQEAMDRLSLALLYHFGPELPKIVPLGITNPLAYSQPSGAVSYQLDLVGGYTLPKTVTYANLPGWLSGSGSGLLTGSAPETPETTVFTATVSDGIQSEDVICNMVVNTPVVFSGSPNFVGEHGYPLDIQLTAVGGVGAQAGYSWTFLSAPAWLETTPEGHMGGLSVSNIAYEFDVEVTDGFTVGTASINLNMSSVYQPVAVVAPASVVDTYGEARTPTAVSSSGGKGTVTYNIVGLPEGLSFAGGEIVGTPTQLGAFNVTIKATDGFSSATKVMVITVVSA